MTIHHSCGYTAVTKQAHICKKLLLSFKCLFKPWLFNLCQVKLWYLTTVTAIENYTKGGKKNQYLTVTLSSTVPLHVKLMNLFAEKITFT